MRVGRVWFAFILAFAFVARAQSIDGGIALSPAELLLPKTIDVRAARVTLQDGGTIDVVEGCWLRTDSCIESARRQVADHVEVKKLEEGMLTDPTTIAAISGALISGIAIGFAVAKLTSK